MEEVSIKSNNTSTKSMFRHLIDPSFQEINRFFVLSFQNNIDVTVHAKYYLPTVKIKDYNVTFDGINQ